MSTNNTDGSALLPVTDAGGYTAAERELLDSLGGYQNVFNAIADATSVYAEGVGVNIGVRAFIRSITPHSQSHPLPGDVGTEAEAWLRAISDWLLANDHDMALPSGVLDTDPLDIADRLAALTPSAVSE